MYGYDQAIGGVCAGHRLCHLLNVAGFECYIFPMVAKNQPWFYRTEYITPLIAHKTILQNLDDYIIIYPEIIEGNPLQGKHVVRWILGLPYIEKYSTYNKSDIIFYYTEYYYNEHLGCKDNILMVLDFNTGIFKDAHQERSGSCYTIRKGEVTTQIHPDDSVFISYSDAGNLIKLSELFNTSEIFYSYDNFTFLSVQAAMCGCLSVVIPDKNVSKEEWLQKSKFTNGIAYGLDDIDRAKTTLPLLFKEIKQIQINELNEVINFANHCIKQCK